MLELKQIRKDYETSGETVHALRGVDLCFRKSEFAAILGPSGCGKTTLLNIIGGLDGYTSGDLIINGISTNAYKDRDWDAYRNHSVGFVFQSYNLIPHQNVLQNVELALTLSGVGRRERRERAAEALRRVGLGDQLKKRPNEMSGGQMQRVAIARAIVNDPDIILADEPTGALDTETGIQIMEILKELSRDRLVIMVTHNPDLAASYATRTINILDGQITGDSDPVSGFEAAEMLSQIEREKKETEGKREKKPSMSAATSFGLSLRNLFTKKGRTILTSFAGSIGIIGIALIYAVSEGATNYINAVQEETLAAYPIVLEAESVNLGSLIRTFMGKVGDREHDLDAVYSKAMIYDLINSINTAEKTQNDLRGFGTYLNERIADEKDTSGLRDSVTGVMYTYRLNPLIYTENVDGKIIHSDASELMGEIIAKFAGVGSDDLGKLSASNPFMSLIGNRSSSSYSMWEEMLPGIDGKPVNDIFYKQYDLLYGSWPEEFNEIILVVDPHNELNDLTLYAMGLLPQEEIDSVIKSMSGKEEINYNVRSWTYEEICSAEYRTVLPSECYVYDQATGKYTDLRGSESGLKILYAGGLRLRVSGIIRKKEGASNTVLSGSIGYTKGLTDYVMEKAGNTAIVKAQLDDPTTDIFTGKTFREYADSMSDAEKADALRKKLASMPESEKAGAFISIMSIPSDEAVAAFIAQSTQNLDREMLEKMLLSRLSEQSGVDPSAVSGYISSMTDDEIMRIVKSALEENFKRQYAENIEKSLSALPASDLASSLDAAVGGYSEKQCAEYFDEISDLSSATFSGNLETLGCVDPDSPASISLYTATFDNKELIEQAIADYNDGVGEAQKIKYTDYVGIMMDSITTILHAITYVLISFVAISLIVSSIMIGVITLISVQERTKEIGVLRALGASKRNVAGLFNAETVLIGFTSGLIGVIVSYLIIIPLNLVLHALTGINTLSAYLPPAAAAALVAISVFLTLIAGIIPSGSAARKDPVVALRTE